MSGLFFGFFPILNAYFHVLFLRRTTHAFCVETLFHIKVKCPNFE